MLLLLTFLSFAQYEEAFKKVREATNIEGLNALQVRFSQDQKDRDARLEKYFTENPTKQKRWEDNEVTFEIYDVIDGVEQIVKTANHTSAITSRTNKLYNGGGLGLNVEGQGMTAFVWDNGGVIDTHVEFPNNKIVNADSSPVLFHSTHVTGTITSQGVSNNPNSDSFKSRGMAFQSNARCYNWTDDLAEMVFETLVNDMLVSNHSYTRSPSGSPAWFFGAYSGGSRDFDIIAKEAPFYLPVVAAGNSRNDFNNPSVNAHIALKGGYDLISGFQTAKNVLTVGAVNQVLEYTGPWDVEMSAFSSWGPTDDGRIKPEVVTKGVQVLSTGNTSNTHYSNASGTSMASPGVAGTALLLQQHYHNSNNEFMRAATLKGLIMHTADECGIANGPDYSFGWGLLNAEKAAQLISNRTTNNSVINELILNNNEVKTFQVRASGNSPLMASISWTDIEGVANTGVVDQTDLKLVNDLDLRILRNGVQFFPWTLNPASFSDDALNNQDNFRDNFERVDLLTPIANELYTIQISHKGTLVEGSQNVSLIVSGINEVLSTEVNEIVINDFTVYPNPSKDILYISNNFNSLYSVKLVNNLGQIISSLDNSPKTIDISQLKAAVYHLIINDGTQEYKKKIIKY